MATSAEQVERSATDGFRHEALLYAGDDGFLAGTVPWIRDAVAGGEPSTPTSSQRPTAATRPSSRARRPAAATPNEDVGVIAAPFAEPLPDLPPGAPVLPFAAGTLAIVRRLVELRACDLVQLRSFASGGVMRLHKRRGA